MWRDLHEWGSDVVSSTINELKGFYIKSGQARCPVALLCSLRGRALRCH
jgi:hypothetical protein